MIGIPYDPIFINLGFWVLRSFKPKFSIYQFFYHFFYFALWNCESKDFGEAELSNKYATKPLPQKPNTQILEKPQKMYAKQLGL